MRHHAGKDQKERKKERRSLLVLESLIELSGGVLDNVVQKALNGLRLTKTIFQSGEERKRERGRERKRDHEAQFKEKPSEPKRQKTKDKREKERERETVTAETALTAVVAIIG